LHRATDTGKDQSYVLFGLRRALLPRVLFPIGGYTKETIRMLARQEGLPVSEKPDSQEICFVPDGDHASFVRRHRPGKSKAGVIRDSGGRVLGRHHGIEQFTVGQRKGLRVAAGARRYVLEVIPSEGTVVVGPREECLSSGLVAERCNWLIPSPQGPITCDVKIAYRSPAVAATVTPVLADRAEVTFTEPQLGVAPGQAVVFYHGNQVLGGGWIVGGRT
jgi:tRNA-specific 2-thiouridylase